MADHPKFVITELYAFIALHPDGEEGVCAFRHGNTMLPMVASDWQRVESLLPIAHQIAKESGLTITLARFSGREARLEIGTGYRIDWGKQTITCLTCGRTSAHPEDVRNRYCGHCHRFHREGGHG
jgi:hypothetical protein